MKLSRPSDCELIAVTDSAIAIDTASILSSLCYLFVRVASFDYSVSRQRVTETACLEGKPSSPSDSSDHLSIELTARREGWLGSL